MRLDFVGVDPDNPADQCPAVFVDSETGDFYMQGETVTDRTCWPGQFRQPDTGHRVGRQAAGTDGGDHHGGGQWQLRAGPEAVPRWPASPA